MDWRGIGDLIDVGRELYGAMLNLVVWNKTNAGQGSFYRSQHELIGVFRVGDAPHRNNVELGRFGRNRSNIWTYAGVNTFGRDRAEALAAHPTVKPVALVADALLDSTARGDLVLDQFAGSGTTILAAEKVGRIGLPAGAKADQLLSTLDLEWQIFPPGTADDVVRRAIAGLRRPNADQQERVRERVAMFNELQPKHFLHGQGGLSSYVGALFADDLVVFENIRYGNALYVLFADWAEVSKRSRIELLRARDVKFERFVHSPGWQERFEEFIRAEKRKRGLGDKGTPQAQFRRQR